MTHIGHTMMCEQAAPKQLTQKRRPCSSYPMASSPSA